MPIELNMDAFNPDSNNTVKLKYSNYYIHKYGHMLVYYYEFENGEWWPYGSDGCGIDYAEVKAMLDEVLESSKLPKE